MKHKQNSRASARFNGCAVRMVAFMLLAFFALPLLPALASHPETLLCLGAMLPIMPHGFGGGGGMRFLDPDRGGGGGGGGGGEWDVNEEDAGDMSEGSFRAKVFEGVKSLSATIQGVRKQVDSQVEHWQGENKKAVEELTKVKNQVQSIDEIIKSLKAVSDARQRELSMALGHLSPVRRVQADDRKRATLNLLVRMACNRNGELDGAIETLRKGLSSDAPPGSTFINDALLPEIFDVLASYGIWNTLGVRRVGTKVTKLPVKTARPVALWIEESGPIPDDDNKDGTRPSVSIGKIGVLLNVPRELLQDSEFDVTADVLDDFGEAIAERADFSFFLGAGTANNIHGGYTGIFNAGVQVVADNGANVAGMKYTDFIKVLTAVAPVVLSRMANWWIHPTMLARVIGVKDDNGRPIFLTALEAPTNGVGSVLGYPVKMGHILPNVDGASQKVTAFGDPQGYVVGLRQDIELASSDHHRWANDERSFRGIARMGGALRKQEAFAVLSTGGAGSSSSSSSSST